MTHRDRVDLMLVVTVLVLVGLFATMTALWWTAREDVLRAARTQGLADRYAVQLDHGRSHAVEWAVCVGRAAAAREAKDAEAEGRALRCWQAARGRAMDTWLPAVYRALRADFGLAVAESWKLGADLADLGTSERREHQARLMALDRLMHRMRDGTLRQGAR